MRDSRCANEGDQFIWFKGGGFISIVNCSDLSFKDIDLHDSINFVEYRGINLS